MELKLTLVYLYIYIYIYIYIFVFVNALTTILTVSFSVINANTSTNGVNNLPERSISLKRERDTKSIEDHQRQDINIRPKLATLSDPLTPDHSINWTSLLLVTMGRSGSTFTSAIISHHEDVFYTSEPLHDVGKDIYNEVIS